MRQSTSKVGHYKHVNLYKGGKAHPFVIHRLVLEVFVGPCPIGCQGCHNDGNATRNALRNLRWDTPAANQEDRRSHGTSNRGSRNGRAKVGEGEARQIKRLLRLGVKRKVIAERFQVSPSIVYCIKIGKTWAHVGDHDDVRPELPSKES